jgi:hypothetical protein
MKGANMKHLTMQGYYAGSLYCGKTKSELKEGDTFCHVPIKGIEKFRDKICLECLKVYDDVEEKYKKGAQSNDESEV